VLKLILKEERTEVEDADPLVDDGVCCCPDDAVVVKEEEEDDDDDDKEDEDEEDKQLSGADPSYRRE
jgi:hypothetical protein